MELIIAEKKNVAEAIATAFGNDFKMKNGYIEGSNKIITWASGHLLELKEPEEIHEKYKEWKLEELPVPIDENTGLKPKKYDLKKAKDEKEKNIMIRSQGTIDNQLSVIERFLKDSKVSTIVHCGDPDSEGQLLIDELITYFNCKKPVMRVLINDNNPNKVRQAFEKIEPNDKYIPLGKSAFARSVADKYLGINATRFFALKAGLKSLRVGRVKTPVLGLIVNRYLEVKNHVKSYYYTLDVGTKTLKKSNPKEREEYVKISESYKQEFVDENKRKELLEKLSSEFERLNETVPITFVLVPPKEILENGKVIDKVLLEELEKEIHGIHKLEISKDIVKNEAPLPFNLIELQQYANKKWGYGSNDVLKITQELRDKFRAITYNRSDCQYLSKEHFKEAPEVIPQILKNLNIVVPGVNFDKMSKCFNDENVTAHHAIIPTNTTVDLTKLDDMQRNIYTAISNYYIAQFLPALISEKTTGEIKIYDEILLRSTSSKVLDYGYKTFLNDKLDDEEQESKTSVLSALYSGIYETTIDGTKILQKETAPKKLYTEATLLKDMTAISKYVSDPILKQALKNKDKDKKGENGGIGTPATRSPIISEIFKDKDIVNQDKYIIPTEKGIKIYQYIADEIKTANVTAEWWLIQSEIEESKAEPIKLLKKLEEDFLKIMSREFGRIDYIDNSEDKTVSTCPKCGKKIYESKISYFCEGYKDDPKCDFSIWKENKYLDIKISKEQAKKLIEGKTVTIKGEKYKIDPSGSLKKEAEKITCPKCKKGELKESPRAYNCSSECGFIFWKNEAISYSQFKQLTEGKIIEAKGLKNKAGDKYNANIKLKDDFTGFMIVKK